MSESTSLDHLLDLWEALQAEQPDLDADAFIAGQASELPAAQRELLRKKILAIQSIDNMLLDSRSRTSSSSSLPASSLLKPQQQPVPGYILQTRLGSGGFGQVWKAIGPGGFEVALKFVPRGGAAYSAESRALDLIRRIKHPNLLKVYGSWIEADWLVIASELADYSLFDRLQDAISTGESGIPKGELLRYMQQAAEAIDFLNQVEIPELDVSGVQHRDIKPQNLLLTGDQVKLADLGISRPVSTKSVSHTGQLSIHYAAPEFFDGKTSRHSDQYGLAVTYVQLRTGHLPYRGNELEVFKGHVKGTPQLEGLLPSEKQVVQRALAKRPSDRWPSCKAFVDALVSPPRVSWWQAISQQLNFSPATRWVLAAVGLCLLGLLTWLLPPAFRINQNATGQQSGSPVTTTSTGKQSVYGTSSPHVQHWPAIETSSFSIGGEDLTQDFRVLRGLRIWQTGFGREDRLTALAGIQGIYATSSGPQLGVVQGFERTPALELLAEPGYIIGRIEARRCHGGRLGGLLIELVRVDGNRCDPSDCYSVEVQVLEQVQSTTVTGNLENPAIGFQLSRTDHELGDFGLVQGFSAKLPEVTKWIADNSAFEPLFSPAFAEARFTNRQFQSVSLVTCSSSQDETLALLQAETASTVKPQTAQETEAAPVGDMPASPDGQSNEKVFTNSLGMRFHAIPAGVVRASYPEQAHEAVTNEPNIKDLRKIYPAPAGLDGRGGSTAFLTKYWSPEPLVDEPVAYLVNQQAFFCAETEVTRGQFEQYIKARKQANPDKTLGFTRAERFLELGGIGYSAETGRFGYGTAFNWGNPGYRQDDTHPVVGVSWTDAAEFCDWLSAKEGKTYRLPTADELEYCRLLAATAELSKAGEVLPAIPTGNNKSVTVPASFQEQSSPVITTSAEAEPANAIGLRGLQTNAAEWCADRGITPDTRTFIATNRILNVAQVNQDKSAASKAMPRFHAHQHFAGPDTGLRIVLIPAAVSD
jgi:serine/threonine protein kinase/formylglycine-generating enzyme required for sulfatase activity